MKSVNKRWLGLLILVATTIAWGTSVILLKQTIDHLPPMYVLAMRFVIAAVPLWIIFGRRLKGISTGTVVRGIILGVVVTAAYVVQTYGLQYTTASRNAFITGSYCVICPFLAWAVERKRPRFHSVIAAFICVAGLAMIAFSGGDDGGLHILGDGLTLLGAAGYAAQIIMIYSFQTKHKDDGIRLLVLEVSTVAFLCVVLSACIELPIHGVKAFAFGWDEAWRILYLGLICTLIAQMAQMIGQKYTSPAQAGMILSMESVFGVLFAIVIGNEKLTWLLGGAFICIFAAQMLNALGPWIDDKIAARKMQVVPLEDDPQTDSSDSALTPEGDSSPIEQAEPPSSDGSKL